MEDLEFHSKVLMNSEIWDKLDFKKNINDVEQFLYLKIIFNQDVTALLVDNENFRNYLKYMFSTDVHINQKTRTTLMKIKRLKRESESSGRKNKYYSEQMINTVESLEEEIGSAFTKMIDQRNIDYFKTSRTFGKKLGYIISLNLPLNANILKKNKLKFKVYLESLLESGRGVNAVQTFYSKILRLVDQNIFTLEEFFDQDYELIKHLLPYLRNEDVLQQTVNLIPVAEQADEYRLKIDEDMLQRFDYMQRGYEAKVDLISNQLERMIDSGTKPSKEELKNIIHFFTEKSNGSTLAIAHLMDKKKIRDAFNELGDELYAEKNFLFLPWAGDQTERNIMLYAILFDGPSKQTLFENFLKDSLDGSLKINNEDIIKTVFDRALNYAGRSSITEDEIKLVLNYLDKMNFSEEFIDRMQFNLSTLFQTSHEEFLKVLGDQKYVDIMKDHCPIIARDSFWIPLEHNDELASSNRFRYGNTTAQEKIRNVVNRVSSPHTNTFPINTKSPGVIFNFLTAGNKNIEFFMEAPFIPEETLKAARKNVLLKKDKIFSSYLEFMQRERDIGTIYISYINMGLKELIDLAKNDPELLPKNTVQIIAQWQQFAKTGVIKDEYGKFEQFNERVAKLKEEYKKISAQDKEKYGLVDFPDELTSSGNDQNPSSSPLEKPEKPKPKSEKPAALHPQDLPKDIALPVEPERPKGFIDLSKDDDFPNKDAIEKEM